MTDEQIIGRFRQFLKAQEKNFSFIEKLVCSDVFDLINRQKIEIEGLQERISYLEESIDYSRKEYNKLLQKLQQAKSEAIKEFARELKCGVPQETGIIRCKDIDTLVKEMTEANNEK